ncbi:MAG: hypothetical protein WCT07_00535 [Candidatus Paceibacterota bacterium]
MSNGKTFRRDASVRADPQAIISRRASAEGHSYRHDANIPPPVKWQWITERDALVKACLDILNNKPKLYPIFGIQLHVEMRKGNDADYPVLVYTDALFGEEGQYLFGQLKSGFAMSPSHLAWIINEGTTFKTPDHELLTLTLLSQPEMQEARDIYFEKQEEDRRNAEIEKIDRIQQLRNQVGLKPLANQPPTVVGANYQKKTLEYAEFKTINQVLGNEIGIFRFDSGEVLKLCPVAHGNMVIRIQQVKDERHPMFEVARRNVCIWPSHLAMKETGEVLEGMKLLEREARVWLREQFRIAGIALTQQLQQTQVNTTMGTGGELGKASRVMELEQS